MSLLLCISDGNKSTPARTSHVSSAEVVTQNAVPSSDVNPPPVGGLIAQGMCAKFYDVASCTYMICADLRSLMPPPMTGPTAGRLQTKRRTAAHKRDASTSHPPTLSAPIAAPRCQLSSAKQTKRRPAAHQR